MSLSSEGQSLSVNQILSTYLNCWLRYNYFRFWNTNVCHIVLSVSILTICPKSARYSASGYRISSNSKHPPRKYNVISISQYGGRDVWRLLPDSYLLMSRPSEGHSLLANQILSRYLKWRLRYNHITTSVFEIQTSAILEFYFRFRSWPFRRKRREFCIWLPNFVQIEAPAVEIWRHIYFWKWRPRPLNTISGFVFVDVTAFRRSKSISKPNFVEISQLAAEI